MKFYQQLSDHLFQTNSDMSKSDFGTYFFRGVKYVVGIFHALCCTPDYQSLVYVY